MSIIPRHEGLPDFSTAMRWPWVCRDQHHKVATGATRRSKAASSESPGSGADWHQFVVCFCVWGEMGMEESKGQWWTCMFIFSINGASSWWEEERGAGWGCWCCPVHARVFLSEGTCGGVYLSSPYMRNVAGVSWLPLRGTFLSISSTECCGGEGAELRQMCGQ